ncbi:predicted protein [Pyrenophora tritici-repentis Pt-1C-BFP]|uniref:Uncharacterized protein n=1 Tax=Pyrenophora tritici-repentis (strain Pt-1C-BFP) TaxID=426418 RepID=B2W0V6_PYRTR|nr:uncharacterized protein PTRG_04091 [Pyrenophora tritici-repentis Pt-1C-BFP]EDU46929.1 predicted protein [Pyrenophora tritici-repentis Pt-1C-BFP]
MMNISNVRCRSGAVILHRTGLLANNFAQQHEIWQEPDRYRDQLLHGMMGVLAGKKPAVPNEGQRTRTKRTRLNQDADCARH